MHECSEKQNQLRREESRSGATQKSTIEIRCMKCNQLMMKYFICGDDSVVALQHIEIKCPRCSRVMMLKKYSEGILKSHSDKGTFKI